MRLLLQIKRLLIGLKPLLRKKQLLQKLLNLKVKLTKANLKPPMILEQKKNKTVVRQILKRRKEQRMSESRQLSRFALERV